MYEIKEHFKQEAIRILPNSIQGKKASGFTLIEVLIALVIVSIALIAIVKSTADTIEYNDYLAQKTIASWVANYAFASIQSGLTQMPVENSQLKVFNHTWYWSAKITATSPMKINNVLISVRQLPTRTPIITMETFTLEGS